MQNQQDASLVGRETKKPSRAGLITALVVVAALIFAVLVNALAGLLPATLTRPDVSGSNTFRITNESKKYMSSVDQSVTLYLISEGGSRATENEIYLFLYELCKQSDNVRLEVIDPAANADFILSYGGEWPENLSVIVQSEKRYQTVYNSDMYYYYVSAMGRTISSAEYNYYCQMFQEAMKSDPSYQATYMAFVEDAAPMFDGNSRICNAINYTLMDHVPVAYMLVGSENAQKATSLPYDLLESLMLSGYQIKTLASTQTIPADCELLIVHAPTSDLSGAEAAALKAYLNKGGKLFLSTSITKGKLENLASVLAEFGLSYGDMTKIVCESDARYIYNDGSYDYPNYFYAHRKTHDANGSFTGDFLMINAHGITVSETAGVTVTPWLYTSEVGYLQGSTQQNGTTANQEIQKGTQTCGVIAEKEGGGRVIWLSSNSAVEMPTNYELIISSFHWAVDSQNERISIASAAIPKNTIVVTNGQFAFWAIVLIAVIPAAVLIVGVSIWSVRRKR